MGACGQKYECAGRSVQRADDLVPVLYEPHFRAGPFVPNYNDGDSRLLNVAPP
jgi:hypothetical protein